MLVAVILPATMHYLDKHDFPKYVNFGINEGRTVVQIPSWVRFCLGFPRIYMN